MKKIKFISTVLLLMTVLFSFNACGSDDDDNVVPETNEKLIVGTWKLIVEPDEEEFYEFKSDGTYSWSQSGTAYGRYKIIGNKLYMLESEKDNLKDESQEWWKDTDYQNDDKWSCDNIEIKDNILTLTYEGDSDSYKRVK